MPSVSVNLFSESAAAACDVMQLDATASIPHGTFIVLRFTPEADVILPGVNRAAAEYARALADQLRAAADTCDDLVIASEAAIAGGQP